MPLRTAFDSHAAAARLSDAPTFADINKAMSAPPEKKKFCIRLILHGAYRVTSRPPCIRASVLSCDRRLEAAHILMRVRSVELRRFKRFHDLKIELPESPKLVILAGPNGCGKSSLFEA